MTAVPIKLSADTVPTAGLEVLMLSTLANGPLIRWPATGARCRVVVPDRVRTAPSWWRERQWPAGAQVRTVPTVSTDLAVIDRTVTVLAADGSSPAVLRLPGVVQAAIALFEYTWANAVPMAADQVPRHGEPTARERELLRLLWSGCTDEMAAERLGVAERTVRRMVANLMARLGARSRFQAGAKAVDRGWLPADLTG